MDASHEQRDHHVILAGVSKRADLPATLRPIFAVSEALALGATPGRLDAADLTAPFRGMRAPRAALPDLSALELREHELRQLCRAYLAVAPADARFSHVTATRLYGMPVPERLVSTDVSVVTARVPPRRRGIVAHRAQAGRTVMVAGLPAVPPEVAWIQLAAELTIEELIVAGDFLVRRKRPLCTMATLSDTVAQHAGRRGIRLATAALARVRPGTDSPPESWTRLAIVRAGFPEPVVGYEVHDNRYWVGTPDLAYPDLKIAIEYQGAGHRDTRSRS